MKLVFRTVFFHILCILIFSVLYYYFKEDFEPHVKEEFTILDYIFLSTTIQSGVGLTDIYPIHFNGKLVMIIQQLILITSHVFTLYVFNL